MEWFPDSFALCPEAQSLVQRVQLYPELQHTTGARIVCIASQIELKLRGDPAWAHIGLPQFQGAHRHLLSFLLAGFCQPVLNGESPEFLVMIDAALWTSLDVVGKEALMFHEMKHLVIAVNGEGEPLLHEDGRYKLRVTCHDVERFHDEIARYGVDRLGLDKLCQSIITGQKTAKRKSARAS